MALRDWLLGRPLTADALEPALGFAADPVTTLTGVAGEIDPAFFGPAYTALAADGLGPVAPVSRKVALSVPAVRRARDLVCGTLGSNVQLQVVDTDNVVSINTLLDQPEDSVARSITMTRLYEDLFFDSVAWWKVRGTNFRGYPSTVERIDPGRVEVRSDGVTYVDGRRSTGTLIQFLSPFGPLLVEGARAIRTLLRLEATASMYADSPVMQGYFRPADGEADPADDSEVTKLLRKWKALRQQGATGYVPLPLKYEQLDAFSPEQMQLVESRAAAVLEIARLTGIDAADLSVEVGTGRTYQNAQDARRQRINDVLGPYATAVTDRLRMADITPRGYEVRADFGGYLRADDKTRLENYKAGLDMGLYTLEDVARREQIPAPVARAVPAPAPASGTVTVTQLPQPSPKEIEA